MPGRPQDEMIRLEDVAKRFRIAPGPGRRAGTVTALAEVTAEIAAGEVVAVVGPNGAGKSTLFSIILGFLEPSDGIITINGADPRVYIGKQGAGYLPERFRLPAEWNVAAALRAFAGMEELSASHADQALAAFGLTEHAHKSVGELSHGMVQRLGLAQATLAERALIVFDEPTEGLDAVWRVRFRDLVARLRERGATVLIASHDLAELERLADRAIILDAGAVREVVALRDRTEMRPYRIQLAASFDAFHEIFPGAQPDAETTYVVPVSDAADLNRRLAALLAAGGEVLAVAPADSLEERITRSTGAQS